MECANIKELLSEYIDNALSQEKRALVEEHLRSCESCSNELLSLKSCINDMAALKDTKAPEGFLKAVHERIDRGFDFENIMRKIFVPVHIKVPVEALAVAASILIMVTVYKNIGANPLRRLAQVPAVVDGVELAKQKDLRSSISSSWNTAKESIKEDADALNVSNRYIAESAQKIADAGVPAAAISSIAADTIKAEVAELDLSSQGVAQPELKTAPGGIARLKESSGLNIYYDRKTTEKQLAKTACVALEPIDKILIKTADKVKELIINLKGTVVNIETNKNTNLPEYITAKIPSVSYDEFLDKLSRLGLVQRPAKRASQPSTDTVEVKIKIRPPQ